MVGLPLSPLSTSIHSPRLMYMSDCIAKIWPRSSAGSKLAECHAPGAIAFATDANSRQVPRRRERIVIS